MAVPVNFDSVSLDEILSDWVAGLREFPVDAVVVLGPDPFGGSEARQVLAAHPPLVAEAAAALAASSDFGAHWRDADAPLAAWQTIARTDPAQASRWRLLWQSHGYRAVVRVAFALPAGRAFECFLFTPREALGRAQAALIAWSALNVWPQVQRAIAAERSVLSPRERECLELAFRGMTARDTAQVLQCTERTVNYHLANAMAKLRVDNKLAAIQRACWLGAI